MMRCANRLVLSRTLLLAGIAFFGDVAQADILFLDVNNSPKEIEAAQKAAMARNEKLIVRPVVPADLRKKSTAFMQTITRLENERNKCSQNDEPRCRSLRDQLVQVRKDYAKLNSQLPRLTSESLKEELAKLNQANVKLSSLIISGHDGNGQFFGTQGDLTDKQIAAAFNANAPLGDSIRSLLLWGCYTTTLGALEFNWKGLFPNANMIAGYDGQAPLNDKAANWSYLEDVLKKEKKLTEAKDREELQKVFKSIEGVNQVTASICLKDEVVTLKNVVSINEEMAKCKPSESDDELRNKFLCFLKAEPGCEDLPKQTGSGPLREYYNYLQATGHCNEIFAALGRRRESPDVVIRLIFDREVRENFERLNIDELTALNDLFQKIGLPEDLRLKDLSKLSRAQYVGMLHGISSELNKRMKEAEDANGNVADVDLLMASRLYYALSTILQKSSCTPFDWVERNAVTPSRCAKPDLNKLRQEVERFGSSGNIADRYKNSVEASRSRAQ